MGSVSETAQQNKLQAGQNKTKNKWVSDNRPDTLFEWVVSEIIVHDSSVGRALAAWAKQPRFIYGTEHFSFIWLLQYIITEHDSICT